MLIYCAHKYGGLERNKQDAEDKIKHLQTNDPENTYISPIHAFGHLYNEVSYDKGMEMCFELLAVCGCMVVLSDTSEGVRREIEYSKANNIPITSHM